MKNREYLNYYKLGDDGKYFYSGSYYTYGCGKDFKEIRKTLIIYISILILAVIGSGCINGAGMNNSFYVIMPFIFEVGCLFFLSRNTIRLLHEGENIKEYVYIAVTKNIPNSSKPMVLFSVIGAVLSLVYIFVNLSEGNISFADFLYPLFKVIIAVITVFFIKFYNTIDFRKI